MFYAKLSVFNSFTSNVDLLVLLWNKDFIVYTEFVDDECLMHCVKICISKCFVMKQDVMDIAEHEGNL